MTANELKDIMQQYQEQTNENFSDLNDDFDDVRKYLVEIIAINKKIISMLSEVMKKMKEGESNDQ